MSKYGHPTPNTLRPSTNTHLAFSVTQIANGIQKKENSQQQKLLTTCFKILSAYKTDDNYYRDGQSDFQK